MPIYEYNCASCNDTFETLVFGSEDVVCPKCGGQVSRVMSACNFKSGAGDFKAASSPSTGSASTSSSSCAGCSATSCATCH